MGTLTESLHESLPVTADASGQRVGTFETMAGASLAVEHLVQLGIGDGAQIVPRGLRPVDARAVGGSGRGMIIAAVAAAATGCAVGLVALVSADVSWAVLSTGAVAALLGALVGVLVTRNHAVHSLRDRTLLAQRFDVVCERDASSAEKALARWWNPAARRARRRPAEKASQSIDR